MKIFRPGPFVMVGDRSQKSVYRRPQLRQKAARQQRDRIANDVFRAASDVSHMNLAYPGDPRIQFELDFTEDYEERRAFEKAKRDKKAA